MTEIKVCIVEDNQVFLETLRDSLNGFADITVKAIAPNGKAFVELLYKNDKDYFDVILMDMMMKPMNGLEATRYAKQRYPDIKVIGISVYREKFENEAFKIGIDDFIDKGCDLFEIADTIRKTYNRIQTSPMKISLPSK